MYDVYTKNKSFLKMSKYLKDNGIKNNKFMLELHNPELVGVDPHSPDLTFAEKAMIYKEVSNNIWYFLREVCRVVVPGNPKGVPFRLIPGTMAQVFTIMYSLNYLLILPRQVGKTVAEIMYAVWSTMFATDSSLTLFFNKDYTQSCANLKAYKAARDLLPQWLKDLVMNPKDIDNSENVKYLSNNNEIRVKGSANSKDDAEKLGRGCTAANIYADEFAFLDFNDVIYNAFYPAWKTASENARIAGAPTGIHITTTPNNLDKGTPGAFCHNTILMGACRFELFMYDLGDSFPEFVHNNSSNDFVFIQYNYKECGKDDEWLEEVKRGMNFYNDPAQQRVFRREYLLEWTLSNDFSVYQEEQLRLISDHVKDPYCNIRINNYNIIFYEEPNLQLNYIISSDTSNGLGLDQSVLVFIHPIDFHIVGLFKSSSISISSFRRLIEIIMTQYFPNAILNMERNMSGTAILEELVRNAKIEPRIYQEQRNRKIEKVINADGIRQTTTTKRIEYGVHTDSKSRNLMIELLHGIVADEYDKIISYDLYSEIKTLQYNKGKIEAMSGAHDDILMAYLITRYAIVYERCFRDKFGIQPTGSGLRLGEVDVMDFTNANDGQIFQRFASIVDSANTGDFTNIGSFKSIEDTNKKENEYSVDWIFG